MKTSKYSRHAHHRFNTIDINGDRVISRDEGHGFLLNSTDLARVKRTVANVSWFAAMDTIGDG
ncbi:hypothetical protein PRIPAC_85065, partial [Pristionchus pacificus]|uniref:Uncharacterized protein n=1 Tax=Pristionchus pacificus TaxID=54126 RepID=A0A2A6BTV8_PRIPA